MSPRPSLLSPPAGYVPPHLRNGGAGANGARGSATPAAIRWAPPGDLAARWFAVARPIGRPSGPWPRARRSACSGRRSAVPAGRGGQGCGKRTRAVMGLSNGGRPGAGRGREREHGWRRSGEGGGMGEGVAEGRRCSRGRGFPWNAPGGARRRCHPPHPSAVLRTPAVRPRPFWNESSRLQGSRTFSRRAAAPRRGRRG